MPSSEFEFRAVEHPDWGGARIQRSVLMIPCAEWVQSVYSTQFELNGKTLIVPNRDYPYEGLLVYQNGENWKFVDCIALNVQTRNGHQLSFVDPGFLPFVRLTPWKTTYVYTAVLPGHSFGSAKRLKVQVTNTLTLAVTYTLHATEHDKTVTGNIEISFAKGALTPESGNVLTIKPFVDLRHMFGHSPFENYRVSFCGEWDSCIRMGSYDRMLSFYSLPAKSLDSTDRSFWVGATN